MPSNLLTRLNHIALSGADVQQWRLLLADFLSAMRSGPVSSAGLVITGAGAATFKTGASATDVLVNSSLVSIAAATSSGALAGTISQNNFGGWLFATDSAGNVKTFFLNQASTLAGVTFPSPASMNAAQSPVGGAWVPIGYVRLNPTSAAFIGGTTLLDAANTNAIYGNFVGPFDPSGAWLSAA